MSAENILLLLTVIFGFYMSWNIGANDVANAMGTSVGSKALSFKKALLVAAIFEFAGAFLVGGHVSETIRSRILDMGALPLDYMVLVKGMVAALIGSAAWIHIATFMGLPVSTTHAIVGAVMGFGIYQGGMQAVQWNQVGFIALSWLTSPLLGALIGFSIFIFIRNKILDSKTPLKNFVRFSPFIMFFMALVLFLFIYFKGLKALNLEFSTLEIWGMAVLTSLLIAFFSYRWVLSFVSKQFKNREALEDDQYGKQYQIIEDCFKYLQVVTACLMAFAHGSNDVANATGPVAAILASLQVHAFPEAGAGVPTWILGLGSMGIVVGLFTYGYKVIRTLGEKITEITPTRGFSAEFGAAFTILFASLLGLPISTTHTIVGAIVGIGFARGIAAINRSMIRNIFSSWFITFPVAAIFTEIGRAHV